MQIRNRWRSNLWIMVELFLVFISLFVCCNMLMRIADRALIKTGFDLDHVYRVDVSALPSDAPTYKADASAYEEMATLVSRLRAYPGVECLGVALSYFYPYTLGSGRIMLHNDTLSAQVRMGRVSPDFLKVFRVCSSEGKAFDVQKEAGKDLVLLTSGAMDALFGKGTMRGRADLIKRGHQIHTCVNLGTVSVNEYDEQDQLAVFISSEEQMLKEYGEMFIRVRPEADKDFVKTFLKEMKGHLSAGNSKISELIPMKEVREETLTVTGVYMNIYMVIGLTVFFILCVLLGVIGTFWFRTEARTAEIGLRLALGATRRQVRRQMVGEGLMLLALVWIPALCISYLLRDVIFIERIGTYVLDMPELLYFGWVGTVTTLLMVALIIAGIWYPARQASKTDPVKALHYE